MKRSIKLLGTDIELVITRAVQLHVPKPFLYLWQMNDETWRIEYSSSFIGDLALIDQFKFNDATESVKKKKGKYPNLIEVIGTTPEATSVFIHQELQIGQVSPITGVHGSKFIHLDYHAASGKWKLCYHQRIIPDISQVTGFKLIRED